MTNCCTPSGVKAIALEPLSHKIFARLVRQQRKLLLLLVITSVLLLWNRQWGFYFALALLLLGGWQTFWVLRFLRGWQQSKMKTEPPAFPVPFLGDFLTHISQQLLWLKKRHDQKKRQVAQFYRQLYQAAEVWPDGMLVYKTTGEMQWCNPKACYLLGLDWPQQAGALLTDVVSHPVLQQYLAQHDYRQPLILEIPNNKRKVLSLYIIALKNKKKDYLLLARDVTRTHYLDRIHKDFVANASHELRTPLTVIHGFLDNFIHNPACPEWQRYFQLMYQQSQRMELIINDLLELSHIENPQKWLKTAVDMEKLLHTLIQEAQLISADKQHQFHLDLTAPRHFQANEKLLYMAFSNLILNAVHYSQAKTPIVIRWFVADNKLLFAVKDRGAGIAARHIPRLTERFYRVDKSRSRANGGTGLGLAIVKHAAGQLGGKLHIHSVEGQGSVFTLIFQQGTS